MSFVVSRLTHLDPLKWLNEPEKYIKATVRGLQILLVFYQNPAWFISFY